MSDPAIEAAERAWEGHTVNSMAIRRTPWMLSVDTAREMARPLQKKHYPVDYINNQRCCVTCFGSNGKPRLWPCEIAPFIYPSEVMPQ